ncbi:MFS transporter [Granulicella cerasi]|uniref:MFS transporter n=1 Tax=Granulicella cerasi TaxID=741063 RepID=A0ABW1Z708_9BACT|nr:MFS transporter [Granulicella cerasi]
MTNTSHNLDARQERVWLGMPLALVAGYIAIVFCMTGDGIEQAFLSKYLVDLGFTKEHASLVFTVYGLAAAISAWLSGVLAEMFTPRRVMLCGITWWLVFHACFLHFGLERLSLPMTALCYGIRGFAYPLFFYGFFVWVVQVAPPARLASAIGWVWAMFTVGYGIVGSYLPSFTVPKFGFLPTLWMSMAWVAVGGIIILFLRPSKQVAPASTNKLAELSKGLTLIFEDRNIGLALITRIICNLSLFGFPVIMPLFYTSSEVGFTTEQWIRIWGTFFLIQPMSNIVWGLIGDRIGWMRQMRWVGFVGCGTATLLFYFLPVHFHNNTPVAVIAALLFALTVTSFVPMGAIFPVMAPKHKGAAVSVQNLGGGLANFCGPALATILLPHGGTRSVVIAYAVLYFAAAVLTLFIRVDQPRHLRTADLIEH